MTLLLAGCITPVADHPAAYPPRIDPPRIVFPQVVPQQRYKFSAVVALQLPSFAPSGSVACTPALTDAVRSQIQTAYAEALHSGFQSVLLSHGYTLTGPFTNRDQMTYGEKEKAILLLVPVITFDCLCQNADESAFSQGSEDGGVARGALGRRVHLARERTITRIRGSVVTNTRVELALVEPLTGEKMWLKTLTARYQPVPYEYYQERIQLAVQWPLSERGPYGQPATAILSPSDGRASAIAHALTAAYGEQVSQLESYFTPAEIGEVIKDAEKVRQLKRY